MVIFTPSSKYLSLLYYLLFSIFLNVFFVFSDIFLITPVIPASHIAENRLRIDSAG